MADFVLFRGSTDFSGCLVYRSLICLPAHGTWFMRFQYVYVFAYFVRAEYAYTLRVDERSDVYSFGVVLLELITGRRPVGEFGDGVDIVRWVRKTTSEVDGEGDVSAAVLAVVDRRLLPVPLDMIINLYKVAMRCVEENSSARPTMREVVHMLSDPTTSPPAEVAV